MNEGFKIVAGNADTKQRTERHEHPSVMLKGILSNEARLINERVMELYQIEHLLNQDGSLNPECYTEVYGEEAIARDSELVRAREIDFTNARNERVQKFYLDKYGATTEDEIIAKWKENKTHEKNGQMEMAVTLLLSKMLGKDFLVVRTAPKDDYDGMDNLILDSVTGEVVGAFDEVHEGGSGERSDSKKIKIQKIADRGGARVRYGLKLEAGKLTRTPLEGVPVFYLGLESAELEELVDALRKSNRESMEEIFMKLVQSLKGQQGELSKNTKNPKFQAKLTKFAEMLSRITPQPLVA